MIYHSSSIAIGIFVTFVGLVLGLSFYLGRKAKSAQGYYTAHGEIHWFVNGVAFAGDYLSAASFLGICGMIAFYGYDGFLYSIGYLAGWVVALFVVAEPLKRLGKFTFADALDKQFNSRGIKLTAAISTLVVSIFYLIPQMVGAGALVKPLLGFTHVQGVLLVGVVVVTIVVTAGMVSTTWVQFIKGSLLVLFCGVLVAMILGRGLSTHTGHNFRTLRADAFADDPEVMILPATGPWKDKPFVRVQNKASGRVSVWRKDKGGLTETQTVTEVEDLTTHTKKKLVNGLPQGEGPGQATLLPVGTISKLPGGKTETGSLSVPEFFSTLSESEIVLWGNDKITEKTGARTVQTTVYYQKLTPGKDVLVPGMSPTFSGLQKDAFYPKLDFLSLMLALFCGTASLPHILIRYYTVKDESAVRKSTVVGIASIGFFYVLTLFLGLGAMTGGTLDVTNTNMAAPLLARSFGEIPFAIISAIAFTTVLGTVSGLIMAASGAVAHDILTNFFQLDMADHNKVRAGKWVAVLVGIIAMVLGVLFEKMNVSFLVGWAFNVAASANLPALVMLLFWKRTTKQGITWAIVVGMVSSLAWILLSGETYKNVYGLDPALSLVKFSQPAIVTIPLGFLTLVVASLLTRPANKPAVA
ncbi:MAG: cation acetate symporter [Polyangiaceae bacterium]|nr:cation acetate symporter [Polyangiaceae bacterium]